MSIETEYQARCAKTDYEDMTQHLPALRKFASMCNMVVEFGTRTGNSTVAFLASGATVISYDIAECRFDCPEDARKRWTFVQADTTKLEGIPACDLLMIDSKHTEEQVRAELKHAPRVAKFIALHDTVQFGDKGEAEVGWSVPNGISFALFEFLAANKEDWRVGYHSNASYGLTILERINS